MTFTASLAQLLLIAAVTSAAPAAKDKLAQTYLKDGKLTATLIFRDTQGGFAGFTGNTFEVKPDGSWTVTRVFNRRVFKPHATGTLSKEQLAELAKVLAKNEVAKLAKKVGSQAQANPLLLTLTFGKTKCTCALPAGTTDAKNLRGNLGVVGGRMLAVRAHLRKTLVAKKKDAE